MFMYVSSQLILMLTMTPFLSYVKIRTRCVKQKFSTDLQHLLDRIPHSEIIIMLGDFNFQVGLGSVAWKTGIGLMRNS